MKVRVLYSDGRYDFVCESDLPGEPSVDLPDDVWQQYLDHCSRDQWWQSCILALDNDAADRAEAAIQRDINIERAERSAREGDRVLTVERVLAEESRLALDTFVAANPRYRGAHWADCLSDLHDADAYCGECEATYGALQDNVPSELRPYIVLVALTLNYAHKTWPSDAQVHSALLRIP